MSGNSEDLIFDDLELKSAIARVGSSKFLLKEASADAACKYRNACARAARMTDGKVTGIDGIGDVEILLVCLCLHEIGLNDTILRTVPETLVREWPARIVKAMFDWVRKVSLLDEKPDGDKVKNLPTPTPDTSN